MRCFITAPLLVVLIAAIGCVQSRGFYVRNDMGAIEGPFRPRKGQRIAALGEVITPEPGVLRTVRWLEKHRFEKLNFDSDSLKEAVDFLNEEAQKVEDAAGVAILLDFSNWSPCGGKGVGPGAGWIDPQVVEVPTVRFRAEKISFFDAIKILCFLTESRLLLDDGVVRIQPGFSGGDVCPQCGNGRHIWGIPGGDESTDPKQVAALRGDWMSLEPTRQNAGRRTRVLDLLRLGMTRQQVRDLLGPPHSGTPYDLFYRPDYLWLYSIWHTQDEGCYFILEFSGDPETLDCAWYPQPWFRVTPPHSPPVDTDPFAASP